MLVELLTAGLLLYIFIYFNNVVLFAMYSAFLSLLIISTFTDFEHQIIPDEITVLGLACGLILSSIFPILHASQSHWQSLVRSAIGAAAGGGIIYGIGLLGDALFKRESMGFGDVKLMAMVGSFIGWQLVIFTVIVSAYAGAIVGLIIMLRHKISVIPYGPYLSLGAFLSLIWGNRVLGWWKGLMF
jgi:leader peptidase (prepilin peptidase)/N-methyltransferase